MRRRSEQRGASETRVVAQRGPAGAARPDTRPETRPGSVRTAWAISFVAFFLLGAGWALSMPYDGPPDELQHATRAYGVADGQLFAGSANMPVRTARSLSPQHTAGCFRWNLAKSASCLGSPSAKRSAVTTVVRISSGASGYNPSYYLLVGPVIHARPTMNGILAARLLTDAEISALLAAAVAVAWSSTGGRRLIGGVLVGLTPVAVALTGAVNPAGVEIGAAVAFWVCLLDLFGPGKPRRWVAVTAGCSGALFAVTRGFGVGWLLAAVAVCALSLHREKLRELWGSRSVRWAASAVAVACLAGVAWGIAAGPNYTLTADTTSKTATSQLVAQELWNRIPYYIDGTVSLTSYGDVPVPRTVTDVWLVFVGLFVLGGLVVGSLRTRVQIVTVLAIVFGMLISADINATRQGIWFSQGRYALPLLVGAPLLGADALGRAGVLTAERDVALLRWMAALLLPLQLLALYITMLRFQHGFPADGSLPLDPFHGRWLPVFGPVVPLLVFCAGLGVLAVAAARAKAFSPQASASTLRPWRAEQLSSSASGRPSG